MASRRQPLTVLIWAFAIFLLTAIIPVSYMVVWFVIDVIQNPSASTSLIVDSRQFVLLGRSFSVAVAATLIALAIGLPSAIALAAKDLPFRALFYILVLIPLLIPPYIMAGAWIHLLAPNGFINQSLAAILGPSVKLSMFSQTGCVWSLAISHFPIIAIILAAGLSKIDRGLHDMARLSTGRWGTFWHCTLPQILPHLGASICLVLIFVLARYGVPSLLGVNTYPVEIFAQFSAFYDDNAAIATALPLMIVVVILILLQRGLMLNRSYASITPSSESDNPITLGKCRYLAGVFFLVLLSVSTFLPFASVVSYVKSSETIFSTLAMFSSTIVTTFVLAFVAAFLSTLIALPIGLYLAHSESRSARFLDIICWLPIAIPGTIVGLGLIKLSNWVPAARNADSFGILLLLAYIGMFSAFSVRIFQAVYRQADPNVVEAACLDCRRWHHRLLYIDIPIHSGAIAASVIIVFVLAVGELNATVLLVPPGKETLAVTIDNLLHYGANVRASVLCLAEAVLVVLMVAGTLVTWRVVKGRQ